MVLEIIALPLLATVTCKETSAVIITVHKRGFTGKTIAASTSSMNHIVKNVKECGSVVVKKASGCTRESSEHQDRLLESNQLQDQGTTSAELFQQ